MPRLFIEIDYTHGTKSEYDWMEDELPEVLSNRLDLDTTVTMSDSSVDGIHDVHSDSDLYELTKRIIDKSPIRKNAENNGDWFIHVLISQQHQFGYLGVMYDLAFDSRERQGCAIFSSAIRQLAGTNCEHQKTVLKRTALHEIGHCMNLVHRFDKTIMTQTSALATSANWINSINFDYAQEDRDFVGSDERAVPGGGNTRAVDGNDVADNYLATSSLQIKLMPFPGTKTLQFLFGEPVCGFLRIKNTTPRSIEIMTPLTPESGHLQTHVIAPGGKDKVIHQSPIIACGPPSYVSLAPGKFYNLPINFYANKNGYMFSKPGQYQISFGIRLSDGTFATSRDFEITLTNPPKAARQHIADNQDLRFIALGGSADKRTLEKINKQVSRSDEQRKRALRWNLFYSIKHDAFRSVRFKNIDTQKFKLLIEASTNLLKTEKSPVCRGKIILDRNKAKAYAEIPQRPLTAKNKKDITAYKRFKKNMIKK